MKPKRTNKRNSSFPLGSGNLGSPARPRTEFVRLGSVGRSDTQQWKSATGRSALICARLAIVAVIVCFVYAIHTVASSKTSAARPGPEALPSPSPIGSFADLLMERDMLRREGAIEITSILTGSNQSWDTALGTSGSSLPKTTLPRATEKEENTTQSQ